MKSKYLKIVFFGSSSYVIPIIEVLKKNFNLQIVITTGKFETKPVPKYCIENKIAYMPVETLSGKNLKSLIINHKSSIGVLADFGLIVPKEILNLFPKGIINIHPSLLPKYKGPTPVQTAILNGEKITGVTLIKLDTQIDHGPILAQVKEEILPQDTAQSLYSRLFKIGAEMLPKIIDRFFIGSLKPKAQNHQKATFTKILKRRDGFIDILNPPSAQALESMIRAYFPWPGVYTKLKMENEKFKIIKFLPNKKIQVEGKKPVSYKDFINGYPEQGKKLLEKLGFKY